MANLGFEDIDYMQDITQPICYHATIGDTKQLIDIRDGKKYWVTKLADGNCWMTQNLDLDIPATGLSAATTDIETDWVPKEGEATIATGDLSTATWPNDNTLIRSYDPGEYVYTLGTEVKDCGTNQTGLDQCEGWVSTTGKTASSDPSFGTAVVDNTYNAHYTVGNYYNYNAATAGTGLTLSTNNDNASGSICPKGWQLPLSGRTIDPDKTAADPTNNVPINRNKSFVNLLEAYGWGGWEHRDQWGNPYTIGVTGTINGVTTNIASNPLYFLRSGYVFTGSLQYIDDQGRYWSSVTSSKTNAYSLDLLNSNINPSSGVGNYVGYSVRCVAQ